MKKNYCHIGIVLDSSGVKDFTRSIGAYTTMYRGNVDMKGVDLSSLK